METMGELGIIRGIGYGQRFIIKRLGAIPTLLIPDSLIP